MVDAAADLDFSGLQTNPNSQQNNTYLIRNTNTGASVTFTSTAGKNFDFKNIISETINPAIHGNAIISSQNVYFKQTGNLFFSGQVENRPEQYLQGILTILSKVTFEQTRDIEFTGFLSQFAGSAIESWSENANGGVFFTDTGNIRFVSNKTALFGGAIVSNNVEFSQIKGNILFDDNHANGDAGGAIAAFNGGAGEVSFSYVTGNVTFNRNEAHVYQGGAIGTNKTVSFSNIDGGVILSGNKAKGDGGAISAFNNSVDISTSFTSIKEGINIIDNESQRNGGAIITNNLYISDITGDTLFSNNKTAQAGGAVFVKDHIEIYNTGNVSFLNNHAGVEGGALFLDANSDSIIVATGGDILFSGNTLSENNLNVANAISTGNNARLCLLAESGQKITFRDPITMAMNTQLHMNGTDLTPQEGEGTIIFSGKNAEENILSRGADESESAYKERQSKSRTYTAEWGHLYKGTLEIEESAVLKTNTLKLYNDAVLKIGRDSGIQTGHLAKSDASSLSMTNGSSLIIEQGDLDLSQGLSLDVSGYLSEQNSPATITVETGTLTLGGQLALTDSSGTAYQNSSLFAQDQTFTLLTDTNGSRGETDFASLADLTEHDGYQGDWSIAWQDNNLIASWTATKKYNASAEQKATTGINSLWSTASNLQTLSTAGLAQNTKQRLTSPLRSNYWISGLGDFSTQRTSGDINGYDYQGGGYAVGGDHKINNSTLVGLAFGQLVGKNQSRSFHSSIDQTSLMGMIYGTKRMELNNTHALRLHLSGLYGSTSNKMTTNYRDGSTSHGKWDNQAYGINGRLLWDIDLSNQWTLSPFIGLEYLSVEQDNFSETGAMARHIRGGRLNNLTLPVGISLENTAVLPNGMKWDNSVSLAYRADIYRENPEANVTLASDQGVKWSAAGCNSARNAVEATAFSRLHLNETWSLYAGYSIEGRDNAVDQSANIGVSLAF